MTNCSSLLASLTALACALSLHAAAAAPNAGGLYTPDQAARGQSTYMQQCASCHGSALSGGGAPALAGGSFEANWGNRTLGDLYNFVHQSMPLAAPNSLSDAQYADIVAFVLQRNGYAGGSQPLSKASDMSVNLGAAPHTTGAVASAAPSTGAVSTAKADSNTTISMPSSESPTQRELDRAEHDGRNWLTYNKGYFGSRYSPLREIAVDNVRQLKTVCAFQTGETGSFQPGLISYDGLLYATTKDGTYAIDATTCEKVWSHQYVPSGPEVYTTNRGVALANGRVIRGTQDGHLFALDAKTGKLLWDRAAVDSSQGNFFSAAPIVWQDLVFIGKGGADWGIRGGIMAYSAVDGALVWRFDLIPTGAERGAESWQKTDNALHGGGSVWTTVSLDPETGTLFVPVGNPAPDFNRSVRPGDNLFTNSLVALDARNGTLKWWYQLVPADYHDWDTTVVSLFDDHGRKLVAVAGKDGILHVLDRVSGKPLYQTAVTTRFNVDSPITAAGTRTCPGFLGGVEWNGPAYSPETGLIYVNAVDWCATSKLAAEPPRWQPGQVYAGLANGFGTPDPTTEAKGWTNAIDARDGRMKWRYHASTPMTAAVTPTAGGLLFTGDQNGHFLALEGRDGRVLYQFNTGGAIAGGVITYEREGRQYVAVASGNSSRDNWQTRGAATVFVFGL